jgi:hypothetical protein
MSAQVTITQLPTAGAITGSELVPIVQNGVTVQTTTGAISTQPTQTQTFLTATQQTSLANSRYVTVGTGLSISDGGAGSFFQVNLTGAALSLDNAAGGIIVKDSASTVASRSIAVSGPGLGVSNANGTGGDPTLALSGQVLNFANASFNGIVTLTTGGAVSFATITGTTDQIGVTNGTGVGGNPTVYIADNAVFPGTGAITVPNGSTAQKPAGSAGQIRYNTSSQVFEGYANGAWNSFSLAGGVSTFSAGSTGFTPSSATGGVVTLAGTLNVSSGGTGVNTLTGYVYGNGTGVMTASTTIPSTSITGLGTMSTQNASAVTITGGTITGTPINNSVIGGSTPAAGTFTSVAMTSGTIVNAPVSDTDIVNKLYADSIATGINFHAACNYATTADLGTVTYANGSSGVGATLTKTAPFSTLTVDGHTYVSGDVGTRLLVKDESNSAYNGVYTVTSIGSGAAGWVLTRATDYDTSGTGTNEIDAGDLVLILYGTANANTQWVQQTPLPIVVGTTGIVFAQFGAPSVYTAGTGLTLSSNQFSITNTAVTAATYGSASQVPVFAVNAQGQLTSVTNTSIAIASGAVSGLAASATTDTTNAANITSGTLPTGRLTGSYTGITGVGTLAAGTWNGTAIGIGYGGTGLTATPTNGQLAIGNGTGYSLATLTAGTNVSISNTAGGITISATPAAGGTVTSVAMTVPSFLSVTGTPITTSGTLAVTLSGTALPVANGGSGATTLTGYLYGNGTSAFTASTTIPNTAITGLGTMSTQAASAVTITGGTINGTSIGATTTSTGAFTTVAATTVTATTGIFGGTF